MRKLFVKMAIKILQKYVGSCKDMGLNSVIYFYGGGFCSNWSICGKIRSR